MANLDQGTGAEDPDAYAARLAAMQRALGGGVDASGAATGPMGPASSTTGAAAGPRPTGFSDPNDLLAGPGGTTALPPTPATGPAGVSGPMGPQGPTPIDQTNAIQRAAAAAGRTGALGTGGTTTTTNTRAAAPLPPVTPQQIATGGSTTTSAPPTVTTGGSLGGSLTTGSNAQQRSDTGASNVTTPPVGQGGTGTTAGTTGTNDGGPGAGTGTTGTGGTNDLQGLTGSIMSQIQSIQAGLSNPGTPTDATAVYLKQSQSILDMLNTQEAQLKSEAEKQGTTIDPATQFTIDKLRQTLDDNLKSTRENLNSRGLYDSGIELELENRLQKGSASDQAQILSDRLSKLQDQLQAGLSSIRSQKVSTAGQFGLAGANAQSNADENAKKNAADREQAALSAMLSLRGQTSTANTASNTLAENARQYNESFGMDKAKFNEQMAATAQDNALNRAAAAARGTSPVPTQIANPYGGVTKTPGTSADMTNAAIAAVGNAKDRTSALSSLMNNLPKLQAAGVDPQAVADAIDQAFPPSVEATTGGRRVGGSQF